MNFTKFNWADANIHKIIIDYDLAEIEISYDGFNKQYTIQCTGLAGLTNICIWDDTIISDTCICFADKNNSSFMQLLLSKYDLGIDYGLRYLSDSFLELKITLVNDTTFSVFCQRISVLSESGEEIETWTIEGNPGDYAAKITTADGTKIMTEEIWKSL